MMIELNSMKKMTLTLIILVAVGTFASAHGLGMVLEQPVGDYIIASGFNRLTVAAEDTVSFDFDLFDKDRNPQEFDTVAVEIAKDNTTYFSAILKKPEFGRPTIDFLFPEAGTYKITENYIKSDKSIANGQLELKVENGGVWYKDRMLIGGVAGLILGVLLSYFISRAISRQ